MTIPLNQVYRFMSEVCTTLQLPPEILASALLYFHATAESLDLIKLGSDVVSLAVSALLLSLMVNERLLLGLKVKLHDLLEIAVKLSSESRYLSAEEFGQRRKILKQKAGFVESVILRVVGGNLETPAISTFQLLEIYSPDAETFRLAKIILLDMFRSPRSLRYSPQVLASTAVLVTLEVLGKGDPHYSPTEPQLCACADLVDFYKT